MDDLRKFARYFLPYKVALIIGVLCILAGVVFNLYIPLIVGKAVDENWTVLSWERLTVSALKVLGASMVSGVFLFLQRRILIGMSRNRIRSGEIYKPLVISRRPYSRNIESGLDGARKMTSRRTQLAGR